MPVALTNKEIIDFLRNKATKLGRLPRKTDLGNHYYQIRKTYGSLTNALVEAKLIEFNPYELDKNRCFEIIINWAKKHNKSPTKNDFRKDKSLPDPKTIIKITGMSWNEILSFSGLKINKPHIKSEELSSEDLLNILKEEISKLKKLTYDEFQSNKDKNTLAARTFMNKFDCTWNELLLRIGYKLEDLPKPRYTKDELTDIILSKSEQHNRTPRKRDIEEHCCSKTIARHFKSYNEALKHTGLEITRNTPVTISESKEELLEKYIELSNMLGYAATARDLNNSELTPNANAYILRFGGINKLKKEAGYEYKNYRTKYTKSKITDLLLTKYKEYGRKLTIDEINKNKDLPCCNTILKYFEITSMEAVWKEVLHVPKF